MTKTGHDVRLIPTQYVKPFLRLVASTQGVIRYVFRNSCGSSQYRHRNDFQQEMLSPSASGRPRCAPERRTRAKQLSMRRSDIRSGMASVRLLPDQNTETPQWYGFWRGLSLVWSRLESRPAFVFVLLSFVFGSAISVVVPPLRGPDEIAHFLRIYSYTARLVHPALVLQERRGTLRPKQRTGPPIQRDNEGVPAPRRHTP